MDAIITEYNNQLYRSRLEARWSVFFDLLKIKYEYEPQKFDFDGLKYIPDFWLPDQQVWIEIKGPHPNDIEVTKASLLSLKTEKNVYIFRGYESDFKRPVAWGFYYLPPKAAAQRVALLLQDPWKTEALERRLSSSSLASDYGDYVWAKCPECNSYNLAFSETGSTVCCDAEKDYSPEISTALFIAGRVKFENGISWLDVDCGACGSDIKITMPTELHLGPYVEFGYGKCSNCDKFLYCKLQNGEIFVKSSR